MKNKSTVLLCLAAFLLWGAACFAFFQFKYPYHLFYQEQTQLFLMTREYLWGYYHGSGWLARLAGDFLTQFYYYRYAGALILTACLLLLGALSYRVCRQIMSGKRKVLSLIIALTTMTAEAICCLENTYRLSSVISHIGIIITLLTICTVWTKVQRIARKGWRRTLQLLSMTLLIAVSYALFGCSVPHRLTFPEWELEKELAVDCEYGFGNWNRVVTIVEQNPLPSQQQLFFYNLIQAQRGHLPDVLLRYQPNNLGTFIEIGPDTPTLVIRSMNELYWALGDMMFTERAALMASVFSRENRNVRMIRRLAECNMVSGDTAAAEKYLRLLEKTLIYRSDAHNIREDKTALLTKKQPYVNRTDTLRLTDNCHTIMYELLLSNPQNTIALDYLLCSDLLLKDIETFKHDYDRFCMPDASADQYTKGTHPLYQQALCIWLAGTQTPEEQWKQYIKRPDIIQRFNVYNRQRGNSNFADTYWYYFDTAKPILLKP